ncbi:MAG: hypothetical protein FJ276_33530 [Planctomycetes bacterium]|nr:hypothetical protein [Planctomycetota bacterium]
MSAIRLYFDADSMERGLLAALRERGVDATTALEAGMVAATDEEQLEYARQEARVLVSFNGADFCRIHAARMSQGDSHAGIVVVPQQRYSVGERLRRLRQLVTSRTAEEMANRLEFLSNWT